MSRTGVFGTSLAARPEQLEDRTLLTVTVGFSETFGLMVIDATDDGDVVLVEHDGTNIIVNGSMVPASDTSELATLANVNSIDIRGDQGEDEDNDFRILSDFTGITVILQSGGGDDTLVGGDGPETFLGQGGNNDIRGNGGDDIILAAGGNNTLVGGAGNDSIESGAGNDQLFGEAGDDTLIGGADNDTISGGSGHDMLSGEDGNDLLFGESGNDTLDGGSGDDGFAFPGISLGNDSLTDSSGEDYLDFGLLGGAVNIDLGSTANQNVAPGDLALTLTSGTAFEIAVGTAFDDTLIGNSGDNFLFGNDGNDEVFGASGHDFLFGQAGDDTLMGEAGADTLNAGAGDDSQQGGSGSDNYIFDANASGSDILRDQPSEAPNTDQDLLDFTEFPSPLNLDLGSTMPQSFGALTLTLVSSVSIENVDGTVGDDTVTGNSGNNDLFGRAGNDVLDGADGDDTLGGAAGNDLLLGGEGNDSLDGFDGEDTLNGQMGDDFLQGGTSSDVYAFGPDAGGNDTIQDQDADAPGTDHDQLDFSVLPANVMVDLSQTSTQMVAPGRSITLGTATMIEDVLGGAGNDTLIGNASDNVLDGGSSGNDELLGEDGNDTLIGGTGNDRLEGSADNDSLVGGDGDDIYLAAPGWGDDLIVELPGEGSDIMDFSTVGTPLQITIGSVEVEGTNGNLATHNGDNIEHVFGGQGGNLVVFQDGASLAGGLGTITGGAGTDTFDYADYSTAIEVNLSTPSTTGLGDFTGFETVIGGQTNQDLIIGEDIANEFRITGNDMGSVNGSFFFSAVENLTGGGLDDTFLFDGLTSSLDGLRGIADGAGGQDTFDFSLLNRDVSVSLGGSDFLNDHVGGLQSIEHFIGPELIPNSNDTIHGNDNLAATWHLTARKEGTITTSAGVVSFTGFEQLIGGDQNDVFAIDDGIVGIKSIDGRDGTDTIDLSAWQADIEVAGDGDPEDASAVPNEPIANAFFFETYIGGQGQNTAAALIGGGETWTLTGPDLFTQQDDRRTFIDFGFIEGGADRDTLVVMPGGSLSGGFKGDFVFIGDPADPGIDVVDYSAFMNAISVDLVNEVATGIPSLTGVNVVFGGSGNDTIIGVEKELGVSLIGGSGNDTLTGGAGSFYFDGGDGDDQFILAPDGENTVEDTAGTDRLDFRNADLAIQLDVDQRSAQTLNSRGDTLFLTGQFEDVIGTDFPDTITAGPLSVPRFLDGRNPAVPGEGDTLLFDAGGSLVSGTTSNSISVSGFADVTHARFETVSIQNAGTSTGTAGFVGEAGELIVTDNEGVDSDLEISFSGDSVVVDSFNGPIEVDPEDGTQVDSDTFTVPQDGITGDIIEVNLGDGDDQLAVQLPPPDIAVFDINYDGGAGNDALSLSGSTEALIFSHIGPDSGLIVALPTTVDDYFEIADAVRVAPLADRTASVNYTGLEPVDMLGVTTTNLAFVLPDVDNVAVIEPGSGPGEFRLRSLNGTFETTDFVPPAAGVFVRGGSGNDVINASAADFPVFLAGGDGDDTLTGTQMSDTLVGGPGNDRLLGRGGGDSLAGDAGNDTLKGGAGADDLSGGSGFDLLQGQGSTGDTLDGGDNDDTLDGGGGNDLVRETFATDAVLTNSTMTGRGNDTVISVERAQLSGGAAGQTIDASAFSVPGLTSVTLNGGGGDDALTGSSGSDVIIGAGGADMLNGGSGNDRLFGGAGADTLLGGSGNDLLKGLGGSGDRLTGGDGNDTMNGGRGIDRVLESGDVDVTLTNTSLMGLGTDVVQAIEIAELNGGPSDNVIDVSAFQGFMGFTLLRGNGGNDSIIGSARRDVINGGDGNDTLLGKAGDDVLNGGDGDDRLSGFTGNDVINGEAGSDIGLGGEGNDTLTGGNAIDTLIGGAGDDSLNGNDGTDTLVGGTGNNDATMGDVISDATANIDEAFTLDPLPGWVDQV